MLPRPRSVLEDVADGARAPVVPTGVLDGLGGGPPPPTTKEGAVERFMDAMIALQQQQKSFTFMVAQAVGKLDESKEILPFHMALQRRDNLQDEIEKAEELADAYRRL